MYTIGIVFLLIPSYLYAGEENEGLQNFKQAILNSYYSEVNFEEINQFWLPLSPEERQIKEDEKLFHYAARYGENRTILRLLKKGINIDLRDYIGATALWIAVFMDQPKTVELLLKKGANPNLYPITKPPLVKAILFGNKVVAKLLIQNGGINLNAMDALGDTALMKAAWTGNLEVAKLLVKGGAGINLILTLPLLPSTTNGTACFSSQEQSKLPHPLLILIILSLAFLIAFSLAGKVSFAFP